MKQGNIVSYSEIDFFKEQQAKVELIEQREKQNTEVRTSSNNISIDTLQHNAGSDLISIWVGLIFLLYLKVFKRKSKIAKGISYVVIFYVLNKVAEFIAIENLMNNPNSKFITYIIMMMPIVIIVVYNVKKFKNKKRRPIHEK